MKWQTMGKRLSALALAAALTVTLSVPAAAASAIGDGVNPTYDEAYYATLDYYGNLLEGSVVKSCAMNGKGVLTDYGVYDEVVNLTDGTVPVSGEDGSTSFQFKDLAPDHFYFEGKTKKPFEELPWTITLRYTLNGVPAKAEDLAGKQGVVEILLDVTPNENASDYARYNYILAATALFNQDDILSLEAEGAQVQLVGNLRTALFLCLPGEERHFTIRVGSDAFSFGGLTVLMMPATLAQLEEIAKLSQRKDDLEEDYRALSGSLDDLLDALADIQNGLYASAKGLDQLEAARSTFSGGKGVLYDDTDRLRGDLSNLADILAPVEQRVQILSQTITDSKTVLNEMTDATVILQSQLAEMEEALYGLERGTYDLRNVVDLAADMENSLLRLESALGGVHVGGSVATNSRALVEKVKNVGGAYNSKDETTFMLKMLQAQGMGSSQAQAVVKNISDLSAAVEGGLIQPDQLTAEQKAVLKQAEDMQKLHTAAQGGLPFRDFCEQLPGVSEDQAKQMSDLWLIYNAGGSTSGRAALRNRSDLEVVVPAAPEQSQAAEGAEEPSEIPAGTGETSESVPEEGEKPTQEEDQAPGFPAEETPEAPAESMGKGQMVARLVTYESLDGDSGADGDSGTDGDSGADGDSGEDGGSSDSDGPSNPGKPSEKDTVGGAVVDLITGGLDSATARIDAIQSELNASLNAIKRPTASVVGDLANLCGELNYLTGSLDDAEDLMAALGESTGTLRDILADVDALRTVLNGYEPTLQEALANVGTLSSSAAAALRDTEMLLTDAENLARSTGKDLDAGTKQSLRGLSAALRQTAKALATTRQVKEAKNTVTQIIEDTWNEYTGDVNNILLMDATAEPVSLTDERNPAPTSIQVLIRTQEIKEEKAEENETSAAAKENTTFWGRVSQMFRDFWNAVTGIFH